MIIMIPLSDHQADDRAGPAASGGGRDRNQRLEDYVHCHESVRARDMDSDARPGAARGQSLGKPSRVRVSRPGHPPAAATQSE